MKRALAVETRNVYKFLDRKIESNKPCMRLGVDSTVIRRGILQNIRSVHTDWIHIAQDREPVENSCKKEENFQAT
jgi:hypothetical protein